jgi:SOS-response transcriptional repressor LexA
MSVATEPRKLTDRQAEVLAAIVSTICEHGHPPTVRALCQRFGFSGPHGMHQHLRALERWGYIERPARCRQAIRVLRLPDGRAVAGFRPLIETPDGVPPGACRGRD